MSGFASLDLTPKGPFLKADVAVEVTSTVPWHEIKSNPI